MSRCWLISDQVGEKKEGSEEEEEEGIETKVQKLRILR
jgi:hypothetical protein